MNMDIRNISIWWYLLALSLFLLAVPGEASELRIGYGANKADLVGDGAWQQIGRPSNLDNREPAYVVQYVGDTGFRWLRWTVGGAYRKGPTITQAHFLSDPAYLDGADDDRVFSYDEIATTVRAATFGVVPTYQTGRFAFGLTLGYSWYEGTTKAVTSRTEGVCATNPNCGTSYFRAKGLSRYMELSTSYRLTRHSGLFVSAYQAEGEHGGEAASVGNRGYLIGVSVRP